MATKPFTENSQRYEFPTHTYPNRAAAQHQAEYIARRRREFFGSQLKVCEVRTKITQQFPVETGYCWVEATRVVEV